MRLHKHDINVICIGDIHYHNSFCNYRQQNFSEARNEIDLALKSYDQIIDKSFNSTDSNNMNRLFHVFTLAAVVYSAINEISTANEFIDKLELLSVEIGPVVDSFLSNEISRLKLLLKSKSIPVDVNAKSTYHKPHESTKCQGNPIVNKFDWKSFISSSLKILDAIILNRVDLNLYIAFTIVILVIAIVIKFMFV